MVSRSLTGSAAGLATAGLAAALAFVSVSCGGGGSPAASTPPVTSAPQPTPVPPSGGGTGGVGSSCALGYGDPNADCTKGSARLLGAVLDAMDLLVQQQPQLFDKSDEAGAGTRQYRVLDRQGYLVGLVANLVAAGYCSERDAEDASYERILVKNENGFSETFDVLTGTGFMRRSGSYVSTCSPASFPLDRSELPPAGGGCGAPYPPPISRMNCKIHFYGSDVYTLDSTALVGPDLQYCERIGFTDGRSLCPVRPEDSPERIPCETWRVGNALDTGRPGPTWTVNGQFCTGPASGCENHPTNQYGLLVYRSGSYRVCANTGACCTVEVQR